VIPALVTVTVTGFVEPSVAAISAPDDDRCAIASGRIRWLSLVCRRACLCGCRCRRPARQKITFGEMRASGVRGLLIHCSDYRCSHSVTISGDRWPDDVRLCDIETAVRLRGADVRPNFDWEQEARPRGCRDDTRRA
jgi:hypothetical protein